MSALNEGDRVCVIGLGNMGSALAEVLVGSGGGIYREDRDPVRHRSPRDEGDLISQRVGEDIEWPVPFAA